MMDTVRSQKLRNVVIMLIVLFAVDLVLLAVMIPVKGFIAWAAIIAQIVVVLYFAVLSFGLIKELGKHDDGEE